MIRILHLEDSEADAILIEETIRREGIKAEFIRVKSASEFSDALDQSHIDVVLADSALPDFDGVTALKMVRNKYPGITYICLSGSSEPAKIKTHFDLGASDFISKNDLPRLVQTLRLEAERHN